MRKLVIGGLLALALGGWLSTPWLALHELREAARAQDPERLSAAIDFPELRESVRLNLLERVARADDGPAMGQRGSRARALGAAVAGALLGPMVDALITPEAIASLLRSQRPQGAVWHATAHEENLSARSYYESPNRFVVSLRPAESAADEDPIQLVFHRDGMFGWKLAELRLP